MMYRRVTACVLLSLLITVSVGHKDNEHQSLSTTTEDGEEYPEYYASDGQVLVIEPTVSPGLVAERRCLSGGIDLVRLRCGRSDDVIHIDFLEMSYIDDCDLYYGAERCNYSASADHYPIDVCEGLLGSCDIHTSLIDKAGCQQFNTLNVTYRCLPVQAVDPLCPSQDVTIEGERSAHLVTPGFLGHTSNYPANTRCRCEFKPETSDARISIEIKYLNLEAPADRYCFDWVQISGGFKVKLCGSVDTVSQRSPRFYSDYGQAAKLEFHSDYSVEDRGAWLVIWAIGGAEPTFTLSCRAQETVNDTNQFPSTLLTTVDSDETSPPTKAVTTSIARTSSTTTTTRMTTTTTTASTKTNSNQSTVATGSTTRNPLNITGYQTYPAVTGTRTSTISTSPDLMGDAGHDPLSWYQRVEFIAGTIAGVVVLAIIINVCVIIAWRRKSNKKPKYQHSPAEDGRSSNYSTYSYQNPELTFHRPPHNGHPNSAYKPSRIPDSVSPYYHPPDAQLAPSTSSMRGGARYDGPADYYAAHSYEYIQDGTVAPSGGYLVPNGKKVTNLSYESRQLPAPPTASKAPVTKMDSVYIDPLPSNTVQIYAASESYLAPDNQAGGGYELPTTDNDHVYEKIPADKH